MGVMPSCNNCGKSWHTYKYCKLPITSIGIILIRYHRGVRQYTLICRKKSLGYVDFLRGKYSIYSTDYILNLINEMTIQEKQDLLLYDFDTLWKDLWGIKVEPVYRTEEFYSKEKFNQLRKEILPRLIVESNTEWTTPEWGFPKGRRNAGENDITCALREFQEETGYDSSKLKLIKNIMPYEEVFVGSNYKKYCHKYFIAIVPDDFTPSQPFQDFEVSDMKWLTYKEAMTYIRDYSTEKKHELTRIEHMLNSYQLV